MFPYMHIRRAGITQLVEYQLPKLKVAGSSPVARSILLDSYFWAPPMKRPPRILVLLRIGAFGLVGLLACGGPSSTVEKQGDFDKAVERFVEGDYRGTI